jgi:hypothetical protein
MAWRCQTVLWHSRAYTQSLTGIVSRGNTYTQMLANTEGVEILKEGVVQVLGRAANTGATSPLQGSARASTSTHTRSSALDNNLVQLAGNSSDEVTAQPMAADIANRQQSDCREKQGMPSKSQGHPTQALTAKYSHIPSGVCSTLAAEHTRTHTCS